jgi:transposase-like protein
MSKLTDSAVAKARKTSNRRRAISATNKFWSDSQKAEACTTYFILGGNLSLTARKLNIPYETLKTWKKSEWWKELENDIRLEERLTLSSKLRNLMDASLSVVEDRLNNGDWIYDQKAGELRRKPVSMKDAGKLAMDAANLRTKMDIQENHTVAAEHIEDKLNKLAKAFSDLAKGKKADITDAEDIPFVEEVTQDAIPKEREEEL